MLDLKNDARKLKYSNMKLNLENFELGLLLFPCPSLTCFSHCHIPPFSLSLHIFIPLTTHLQLHTPLISYPSPFSSLHISYPSLNSLLSLNPHSYPLNPFSSMFLSLIFFHSLLSPPHVHESPMHASPNPYSHTHRIYLTQPNPYSHTHRIYLTQK